MGIATLNLLDTYNTPSSSEILQNAAGPVDNTGSPGMVCGLLRASSCCLTQKSCNSVRMHLAAAGYLGSSATIFAPKSQSPSGMPSRLSSRPRQLSASISEYLTRSCAQS